MKTRIILIFSILFWINVNAQFSSEQIITTNLDDPYFLFSADLDGDGDMDVISGSVQDNKIVWFENTDSLGAFGAEQIINDTLLGTRDLAAHDIDGDGDFDILVAYSLSGLLAWFENTDGLGNFGSEQIISTDIYGMNCASATDFDGDGDLDVLTATTEKVEWFENLDGLGSFGPENVINIEYGGTNFSISADIDGDGDMDVLAAFGYSQEYKISWYENTDGLGNFGPQQIITTYIDVIKSIFTSDLDGDGDMDVLSASRNDNKIAWYENTDGFGSFGTQQIISDTAYYAFSVYAADIDNDGDQDIFTARGDDYISWYENTTGLGDFGSEQIISDNADGAVKVFAADINGDGLVDALSASSFDDKIAWYSNGLLGTEDYKFDEISLYPNPAKNKLSIQNTGNLKIVRVRIYDALGRLILEKNQDPTQINLSNFNEGLFFVEVTTELGRTTKKLIIY